MTRRWVSFGAAVALLLAVFAPATTHRQAGVGHAADEVTRVMPRPLTPTGLTAARAKSSSGSRALLRNYFVSLVPRASAASGLALLVAIAAALVFVEVIRARAPGRAPPLLQI